MTTRLSAALDGPAGGDALLVRLRGLLPELSGAPHQVAEAVPAHPSGAARATIVELVAVAQRVHDRATTAFVATSEAVRGHRVLDTASAHRRGVRPP